MASPILVSVQRIDYNCKKVFPSIQSISPCTILYSLTPKTASIQQFKLLQLLLKEEPQKKDQQLKRNKKGGWGWEYRSRM